MPFDALVTNPGRLRILTALAGAAKQPFVSLRRQTGLTDGNLSTHARRLQVAGFITIEKSIASGKPLTTLHLTPQGRDALAEHARSLLAALEPATVTRPAAENDVDRFSHEAASANEADDWVD